MAQNQKQTCVYACEPNATNISICKPKITGEFQIVLYFSVAKGACFQNKGKHC